MNHGPQRQGSPCLSKRTPSTRNRLCTRRFLLVLLEQSPDLAYHFSLVSADLFMVWGNSELIRIAGPFELLKNGRQMSGLLDKKVVVAADEAILKNGGPVAAVAKASLSNPKFDQALHASHRDMGTMRAGYLVYQRVGIRGLYSGIRLHARS